MTDVDWGPVTVWAGAFAFASFLAVIVALVGGMGWLSRRHRPLLIGLTTDGWARSDIDPVRLRWAGVPRSRSFGPVDLSGSRWLRRTNRG